MKQYARLLRADFMKMRHSTFYKFHVVIPVMLVIVLILYYANVAYSSIGKVQIYVETIAVAFPFVGAIMVSIAIELDAQAGNFKELLSCEYGKSITFMSKISSLLIGGAVAVTIAVAGFYIGFTYLLRQNCFGVSFYIMILLIFVVGQIIEYIFHSILCLWYGQGITIAVGIVETLITALMLTGLGDGRWILFPCSWSARLCDYCMVYYLKEESFLQNMHQELGVIVLFTIFSLIIALGLFKRFEGRKEKD
jgi:ABC-2 type transport system permease protein